MSLFFFVLSRCHFFFFFFISLFLSLFCPPSPIRGETILLALCHFSFLFYQGVTSSSSSSSLSLYFSLCFVCRAELMEKQFYLLYVTFLFFFFFFIKVSLLLLVYLFISLFVLSAPSPVRGETILLALCHFSFLFYQGVR